MENISVITVDKTDRVLKIEVPSTHLCVVVEDTKEIIGILKYSKSHSLKSFEDPSTALSVFKKVRPTSSFKEFYNPLSKSICILETVYYANSSQCSLQAFQYMSEDYENIPLLEKRNLLFNIA